MVLRTRQALPSLLGRGLLFPIQFSESGGLAMVEGDSLIDQSIRQILLTRIGERPLVVRGGVPFGSMLPSYLFRSAEEVRENAMYEVKRALGLWEPRIIVNTVHVSDIGSNTEPDPRVVRIIINYRYRSSSNPDNTSVDLPPTVR